MPGIYVDVVYRVCMCVPDVFLETVSRRLVRRSVPFFREVPGLKREVMSEQDTPPLVSTA